MYVNGEMKLIKTIPGIRVKGIKENDRGGELNHSIV
jgi:hypothetical protein